MERFYTYPRFASWLREELNRENDPTFVVRVLKHTVSDIRDIRDDERFLSAHAQPGSTGSEDWDRVIRAAAEMTFSSRFPGEAPPWSIELEDAPSEWFYPTSRPSRFTFNLERTPAPFARRRVCIGEGNLRTAKDHDRPWN